MHKKYFNIFAAIPFAFLLNTTVTNADAPGPNDGVSLYNSSVTSTSAAQRASDTPLTLYQNTIEIITLYEDAGSIILSNPAPVEMIVENSRRLVLRPIAPGVTSLTVISAAGQVIYNRDIIVSNAGKNFVSIKRLCEGDNCEPTETYYCPDGCFDARASTASPSAVSGAGAGLGGGSNAPPPPMIMTYPPVNADGSVGPIPSDSTDGMTVDAPEEAR